MKKVQIVADSTCDLSRELIEKYKIDTQDELIKRLKESGFSATQVTMSRDIKELRLVKVRNDNGVVCYRADKDDDKSDVENRLRSIFKHSMVSIDSAENDVVIKTLPGVGGAAAAAIDAMHWPEVVGTIAGDDTILMITRSSKLALDVIDKLKKI